MADSIVTPTDSTDNPITEYGPVELATEATSDLLSWTTTNRSHCEVCRAALQIAPREDCLCEVCESLHVQITCADDWADGHSHECWGYFSDQSVGAMGWHPLMPATIAIARHKFDHRPNLDDLKLVAAEAYRWSWYAEHVVWPAMDKLTRRWGWTEREFSEPPTLQERLDTCVHPIRYALTQITDREDVLRLWSLIEWIEARYDLGEMDIPLYMVNALAVDHRFPTEWIDAGKLLLKHIPYAVYLRTDHWKNTREAALDRAHHRCQVCNATKGLQTHHRTYQRRGAELPEDLIVLCHDCHSIFHREGRLAR